MQSRFARGATLLAPLPLVCAAAVGVGGALGPAAARAGVIDVAIIDVGGAQQDAVVGHSGRLGVFPNGRVGVGISTTAMNAGTMAVDWYGAGFTQGSAMDDRHPVIGQNVFRKRNGRLEQIGLSWIKHTFFVVNDPPGCGPSGNQLLPGCSDTYGAPTNSRQDMLGPRSEVNPFTGVWTKCGSYFDTGAIGYGVAGDCLRTIWAASVFAETAHMIRLYDQDVLAADTDAGVPRLYVEGFYVTVGDTAVDNNFRWRPITAAPDPTYSFADAGPSVPGGIIFSWGELQSVATPTSNGKVVAATRVVDLGGGMRRYEYNVYNMNRDGGAVSLSVPVPAGVSVGPMGFFAPLEDEDTLYDTGAWGAQRTANAVVFSAPTPAGAARRNAIRYGTMYTFWFTAGGTPTNADATLDWQVAGASAGTMTAAVRAPRPPGCPADITGDGVVNSADLARLLGSWGTSDPDADLSGDGSVSSADLALLLGAWGPCP